MENESVLDSIEVTSEQIAKEYAKVWGASLSVVLIDIGILVGVLGILGFLPLVQAVFALALLVISGGVQLVPSTNDLSKQDKK